MTESPSVRGVNSLRISIYTKSATVDLKGSLRTIMKTLYQRSLAVLTWNRSSAGLAKFLCLCFGEREVLSPVAWSYIDRLDKEITGERISQEHRESREEEERRRHFDEVVQ